MAISTLGPNPTVPGTSPVSCRCCQHGSRPFLKWFSDFPAGKKAPAELPRKPRRSFLRLVFSLLLLLLLGLAGVAAVCHLTDMRKEAVCVPVTVAVDDGLLWAREQEDALRRLVRSVSAALKDFLESSQASKN